MLRDTQLSRVGNQVSKLVKRWNLHVLDRRGPSEELGNGELATDIERHVEEGLNTLVASTLPDSRHFPSDGLT